MAALSTVTAVRAGVSVAGVAANAGGDTFTNTGAEVLIVKNGHSSPQTVTVVTSQTSDGLAVADRAVAVANGAEVALGPWPRYVYGSTVSLTYSGVTALTVAVLKVTPEAI